VAAVRVEVAEEAEAVAVGEAAEAPEAGAGEARAPAGAVGCRSEERCLEPGGAAAGSAEGSEARAGCRP